MDRLLEASDLSVGYNANPAVRSVNLHVDQGEVVALLGANGAGKTTTLLGLSGVLRPMAGVVRMDGRVVKAPLHWRAKRGLAFVPETKSVFSKLTTLENLSVGRADPERVFSLFPELRPRATVKAGLMSGGEQQMLTLARALCRDPRLLLADELSLGLAPQLVERLLETIRKAADQGVGVLLVEQHIGKALAIADRVYVMRRGVIEIEGTGREMRSRIREIEATYLSGTLASEEPDPSAGSPARGPLPEVVLSDDA